MADIAQTQIQRLISLVAWMSQRDTGETVPYRKPAAALGVLPETIRKDLQVLVNLTEGHRSWLGSLSLTFTQKGFTLSTRGPFQRPLRLSAEEWLVLKVGLSGLHDGKDLAERISQPRPPSDGAVETSGRSWAIGPTPSAEVAGALDLLRDARDRGRKVDLLYCGSGQEPSRRLVHPYQVAQSGRNWYLIGWCEKAGDLRHFRVERILGLTELEDSFQPASEFRPVTRPDELIPAEAAVSATVAFSPRIARWLQEEHPGGEFDDAGRYLVRFPVADPGWLIREVMQYGAEAELIAPEGMRELMRRWLA